MSSQLCSQGFPCLEGSELGCSGGNVPPWAMMGLWADLWQAGVLIKCLLVFKVSLCKTAWQKDVVLHGEHLLIAAMSWRWGQGGRAWKCEGQALSGDLWDPGEDSGGSVDWQGPTLRGKSAQLAERHLKHKRFGAVHPDHAIMPGALGCLCICSPVKRGETKPSWRKVDSGSHLGCSQLV